jgi:hypothetical protein
VRELAEVKSIVAEKVRAEIAASQLKEKVNQIKSSFEADKSIERVAQEGNVKVTTVVSAKRKDAKEEQKDVFEAAFSMMKPENQSAALNVIQTSAGDWAFIKLNNVEDVNVADNDQEYIDTKKRLTEAAANNEFSVFEHQLQSKAVITRKEIKPEAEQQ